MRTTDTDEIVTSEPWDPEKLPPRRRRGDRPIEMDLALHHGAKASKHDIREALRRSEVHGQCA
jgi:hypothetical protein